MASRSPSGSRSRPRPPLFPCTQPRLSPGDTLLAALGGHCFVLVDFGSGPSWASSVPAGSLRRFRPCRGLQLPCQAYCPASPPPEHSRTSPASHGRSRARHCRISSRTRSKWIGSSPSKTLAASRCAACARHTAAGPNLTHSGRSVDWRHWPSSLPHRAAPGLYRPARSRLGPLRHRFSCSPFGPGTTATGRLAPPKANQVSSTSTHGGRGEVLPRQALHFGVRDGRGLGLKSTARGPADGAGRNQVQGPLVSC